MFLSGRLATFATLTLKLADQAAKGFKGNVNYYRKTEEGGALFIALESTAKIAYKLGNCNRYQRMIANGATGSYNQACCVMGSMIRLLKQRPFLEAIFKEANWNKS